MTRAQRARAIRKPYLEETQRLAPNHVRRAARAPALILILLLAQGCVTPQCSPGLSPLVIDTLYFGTNRANAGPITDAEWTTFLDHEITPRFSDGLTWWRARGQWRGRSGKIESEDSFVLRIAHRGTRGDDAAIASIIGQYKERFAQESVMRTRSPACVGF